MVLAHPAKESESGRPAKQQDVGWAIIIAKVQKLNFRIRSYLSVFVTHRAREDEM